MDLLEQNPLDWRRARRYAEADSIRAALAKDGITLEDHPDGTTTWRKGA